MKKNENDCLLKTQNFAKRINGSIRFDVCSMLKNNHTCKHEPKVYKPSHTPNPLTTGRGRVNDGP